MPLPIVSKLKHIVNAVVRRREEGQDLLEYALLMALISIFAMGAVATLGNTINTIFWQSIASNF
jgi:Flp pilus assembly pilin Flp